MGGSRARLQAKQEGFMKYLMQIACAAALIGLSSNVYAFENGINYDPAHNQDWEPQRKAGHVDKMKKIIKDDLAQIKTMGFRAIKTYYSTYCTDQPVCIDIAEYVNELYP